MKGQREVMYAPVRVSVSIPEGDLGVEAFTIPWMRRLIDEGKQHPAVQNAAAQIVASNPSNPVESLYRFVQRLPYVEDREVQAHYGLQGPEAEVLQGAPILLQEAMQGRGLSDCDCRTILLNSLLEARGIPTALVVVKSAQRPDWEHVYSRANLGGQWIALDTIFPRFGVGDEVSAGVQARRVFPQESPLPLAGAAILFLGWRYRSMKVFGMGLGTLALLAAGLYLLTRKNGNGQISAGTVAPGEAVAAAAAAGAALPEQTTTSMAVAGYGINGYLGSNFNGGLAGSFNSTRV